MDFELIKLYAIAISGIITAATTLTALTPTKIDDNINNSAIKIVNVILKILNVLAGNFGKNKNADDK